MTDRRSIEIEGLSHLTAIPVATRVGPLVTSSVIAPFDPGTRDVPKDADDQLANIFTHIAKMLDAAGASWNDVAKLDFWTNAETRKKIDGHYLQVFPDEASRPARHTHASDSSVARASFIAYVTE